MNWKFVLSLLLAFTQILLSSSAQAAPSTAAIFTLVDYEDQNRLMTIENGSTVHLSAFKGNKLNIAVRFTAVSLSKIKYVKISGGSNPSHEEQTSPFTYFASDLSNPPSFSEGSLSFTAEAFGYDGEVLARANFQATLTLSDVTTPKVRFTLVDHHTQATIVQLSGINSVDYSLVKNRKVNILVAPEGTGAVSRVRLQIGLGIQNFYTAGPHLAFPDGLQMDPATLYRVSAKVYHTVNGKKLVKSGFTSFKTTGSAVSSTSSSRSSSGSSSSRASSASSSISGGGGSGNLQLLWSSSFERGHPGGEWDKYQQGYSDGCQQKNGASYGWCMVNARQEGLPEVDGPTIYKGVIFKARDGKNKKPGQRPYPLKTWEVGQVVTPAVIKYHAWIDFNQGKLDNDTWIHYATYSCNKIWDVHTMVQFVTGKNEIAKMITVDYEKPALPMPKKQWVEMVDYMDYSQKPGVVARWLNGKLLGVGSGGNVKLSPKTKKQKSICGTSSLTQAHWGMYAPDRLDNGVQYNDNIRVFKRDGRISNFDVAP